MPRRTVSKPVLVEETPPADPTIELALSSLADAYEATTRQIERLQEDGERLLREMQILLTESDRPNFRHTYGTFYVQTRRKDVWNREALDRFLKKRRLTRHVLSSRIDRSLLTEEDLRQAGLLERVTVTEPDAKKILSLIPDEELEGAGVLTVEYDTAVRVRRG